MNEYGKNQIKLLSGSFFMMFFILTVIPYYEANGNKFPHEDFTALQYSECAFWAVFALFLLLFFHVLSYLASGVCCYIIYFVQRFWYLHKLRKPERVYTGDPL